VGWQVGLLDNHVFAISFQIASSRKTSGKQSTGPTGQGGVGGGSSSGGVKNCTQSAFSYNMITVLIPFVTQ